MSKIKKFLPVIMVLSCSLLLYGDKASAAPRTYTTSSSPGGYRTLCTSGVPVDFTAYPSNVAFDESTNTLSYNLNIKWKNCDTATATRAYAIYAPPEICPTSGWYGSVANPEVHDCVKYIGNPPGYGGPGNGLQCPLGNDADCVTDIAGAVQRMNNEPSGESEVVIPMSRTNGWIPLYPDTDSWTIGGNNVMCQYYKTGNFNSPTHNNNQCQNISVSVSWVPTPQDGSIYTSKYFPPGEPNDGPDIGEYPAVINDASVCLRNKNGGNPFGCSANNPWRADGISPGDNPYRVSVNVPAGYRLNKTSLNNTNSLFTCTGPNNTGTCTVTNVNISNSGGIVFVDFWFENPNDIPYGTVNASCTTKRITGRITDPDNNGEIPYFVSHTAFYTFGGPIIGQGTTSGGYYEADFSSTADTKHTYYVMALNVIGPGNNEPVLIGILEDVSCPDPPPNISCKPADFAPKDPQPGEDFTVTVGYEYEGSPKPVGLVKGTLSVTGGPTPTNYDYIVDGDGGGSFTTPAFSLSAGAYTISWDVRANTGGGGPQLVINCQENFHVAQKPYLKVFGNDIQAGGKFNNGSNNCGTLPSGNAAGGRTTTILAHSMLTSASGNYNFSGASVEFAAYALAEIDQFYSAGQSNPHYSSGPPHDASPQNGLTFGNYSLISNYYRGSSGASVISGQTEGYGGKSGMWRCIPDYWSYAPSVSTDASQITPGMPATSDANVRHVNHPSGGVVEVKGMTNLYSQPQKRQTVFIEDNVYISDNIIYSSNGTTIEDMPYFTLIVKGNIYISPMVTQLDGLYIAQPHDPGNPASTGGKIYTCAKSNGTLYSAGELFDACGGKNGNRLTVNGAFIAKQIKFLRTTGSLNTAVRNEGSDSGNIAEVFNFSPEMYLSVPVGFPATGGPTTGKYDSIRTLPPLL